MTTVAPGAPITRKDLIALLNDDLEREYQTIIACVVYAQVLKARPRATRCASQARGNGS